MRNAGRAKDEKKKMLEMLVINEYMARLEAKYVEKPSLSDDDAEGLASVDLGFFALDFEALGAVEEGTFEAFWEGDLAGFADLNGSLDLERVTRDLTGE